MAENPASWGEAERIISDTIDTFDRTMHEHPDLCGATLPRQIADALREAGLLKE